MKRHHGFTLIEMLIATAIIAILAALLFPVFARVKERAGMAACASNLRQLGAAFELYADDYGEAVIDIVGSPSQTYADDSDPDYDKPWYATDTEWIWLLRPYVSDMRAYACPTNLWTASWADLTRDALPATYRESVYDVRIDDDKSHFPNVLNASGTGRTNSGGFADRVSYSVAYGGWLRNRVVFDAIRRNSSQAILLGETRRPQTFFCGPQDLAPGLASRRTKIVYLDTSDSGTARDLLPPLPAGGGWIHTHQGRTNWLFFDGHVRALTVYQTLTPSNRWTTRAIDQSAFDALAREVSDEYR